MTAATSIPFVENSEKVPPSDSAASAGLRYTRDDVPGIRRIRRGKSFEYRDPGGKKITSGEDLERIRKLAIPPAYEDVWISTRADGHLQATGRDARGRKQYRYHPRWREIRDETKFEHVLAFAAALPRIRARVDDDLARRGLPREKVLAAVVALLESTLIRVGNDEYARDNGSFGLTTLRSEHLKISGTTMRFRFRGKSGKTHDIDLVDRRLAKVVARCRSLPGEELFHFVDDGGESHTIDSADVNTYLHEISGGDFTAKDFRTWHATLLCSLALAAAERGGSQAARKKVVAAAAVEVAARLGNTPAVCRKSYIHPSIVAAYLDTGELELRRAERHTVGLHDDERALIAFFEADAEKADPTAGRLAASLAARHGKRRSSATRRSGATRRAD